MNQATSATPSTVPGTREGNAHIKPRQSISWCSRTSVTNGMRKASHNSRSGMVSGATMKRDRSAHEPEPQADRPLHGGTHEECHRQDGHGLRVEAEDHRAINQEEAAIRGGCAARTA